MKLGCFYDYFFNENFLKIEGGFRVSRCQFIDYVN
jgi:hypothetical protein